MSFPPPLFHRLLRGGVIVPYTLPNYYQHSPALFPPSARERTRPTFSVPVALVERDVTTSPSLARTLARFVFPPCFSLLRFRASLVYRVRLARADFPRSLSFVCPRLLSFVSPLHLPRNTFSLFLSHSFVLDKMRPSLCPSLRSIYDESLTNSCLAPPRLCVEDIVRYMYSSRLSIISGFLSRLLSLSLFPVVQPKSCFSFYLSLRSQRDRHSSKLF